jgi:hypothetical protein
MAEAKRALNDDATWPKILQHGLNTWGKNGGRFPLATPFGTLIYTDDEAIAVAWNAMMQRMDDISQECKKLKKDPQKR